MIDQIDLFSNLKHISVETGFKLVSAKNCNRMLLINLKLFFLCIDFIGFIFCMV